MPQSMMIYQWHIAWRLVAANNTKRKEPGYCRNWNTCSICSALFHLQSLEHFETLSRLPIYISVIRRYLVRLPITPHPWTTIERGWKSRNKRGLWPGGETINNGVTPKPFSPTWLLHQLLRLFAPQSICFPLLHNNKGDTTKRPTTPLKWGFSHF